MKGKKLYQWEEMTMGTDYYPEHWDRSLWEEDLDRMLKTGITVIRIAEFAWNIVEPEEGRFSFGFFDEFLDLCLEKGMKVIFGTPTATPPAWLTHKYPEVLNANVEGTLYRHGGRRHYNYNSPIFRSLTARVVEKEAEHYAKHPAIVGWQIDNEFNCEINVFYSEADSDAFRAWTKARYGTLEELNRAWGTAFWSQTYSAWEQIYVPRMTNDGGSNPHMHLDYYRFISDSCNSFCKLQADIIRKYLKPGDYITTNGSFANIDYPKMMDESLDVFTYDSYPNFAQSLGTKKGSRLDDRHWVKNLTEIRSINKHFGIMEQQSGGGGWVTRMLQTNPRPGQVLLWAMQSVAQGADYIGFFRWRTATIGTEIYWHGILDYDNRNNRKLAEVKEFYRLFKKLDPVCGADYKASFAMLTDYDNACDAQTDIWSKTFRSASEEGIFEASELNHTPYDIIQFNASTDPAELAKYPVIIYPHPCMIDEERTGILKAYAEQGGTLLIGCRAGYKDMNGHCYMMPQPGPLAELTGTDIRDFTFESPMEDPVFADLCGTKIDTPVFNDVITPLPGTKVLAAYGSSYYRGEAALTEHAYGKGRVLHFGSTFSVTNMKPILQYLGICEPFAELVHAPEEVQLVMREKDGERFLFALNYQPEEREIELKGEVTSMFTGEKVSGKTVLPAYGVEVFRV